ncbi:glycosyltransferase involved in cell wall biosynthesis [Pseudonocardia hierapolitana]|uniref:Glycosyltransferase involved in cell wall biosynthesis n=1 Tax=Pseudonocardia hierapolitana TaxID=1128676 RepID=A0A561SVT0_9PSEU|nr:glycosyltransferase family 4 protein [Pseudonocardia hierapolitana]TWF78969.1 glycosyltransferase involved in cell wall biosynthesis [Pseudonocardia hierapolitana]
MDDRAMEEAPVGRVLCVSTSLDTRGGIASYVRTIRGTPLWTRWQTHHVVTHRDGSRARKIGTFASAVPRYLRTLAGVRPDLVHLHMSSAGSFFRKAALFWIARAFRVPVLVHIHSGRFDRFHDRLPAPLRWAVRSMLTQAAVVVTLGEGWAARISRIAPRARVEILPNAVVVPEPAPPPADGPLSVVFLGAICEAKGAFSLLEAWAKLAAEWDGRIPVRLTLAGDRGVDDARRTIADLGIEGSAEVLDWLPASEVAALLASADVFVLPSRSEGQPMSVLEAMAHGLCVVASGVGGIPELVEDGRSGLLVPPDDVGSLGNALRRVVGDRDLRERLGGAARRRVLSEFDVDVIWRRLDALYLEVIER